MSRKTIFGLAALIATAAGLLAADAVGLHFEFERYNGVHEDLEAVVEPIRSGPVTIRLSSPNHRVELEEHSVTVSGFSGDLHQLEVKARFTGAGSLIADLDFGGVPATLEDQVELPLQDVEVEAKVTIEAVDEGYRITAERLPPFVEVEMRSRLGRELVSWCERLALFIAGDAGCSELDEQLSRPRLPLPAPGTSYVVRREHLTSEEQARIDVYLAAL